METCKECRGTGVFDKIENDTIACGVCGGTGSISAWWEGFTMSWYFPKKLEEWATQPGRQITPDETYFVLQVGEAARKGVGFGFMQQVIEWMWQEKDESGAAWGPEYFNARITQLEADVKGYETAAQQSESLYIARVRKLEELLLQKLQAPLQDEK